jgi:hypothetical protein
MILSEPHDDTATVLEAILRGGIDKALRADLEWTKFIAERTEGKVKDVLDLNLSDLPSVEDMARYLLPEEIATARRERWDSGRLRAVIDSRRDSGTGAGPAACGDACQAGEAPAS